MNTFNICVGVLGVVWILIQMYDRFSNHNDREK